MERVPEPELMLDEAQVAAYAAADFDEPHGMCIELLGRKLAGLAARGAALDLGCGPGDVTMRLARALPGWTIDALDGSPAMLEHARRAAIAAGVESRVCFRQALIPRDEPPRRAYDLVFSNSLLHHLEDPDALWSAVARFGSAGGSVFVMDLTRPGSEAETRAMAQRYTGAEPEVLRRDFCNSLRAAYRPGEVREQLARAGIARLELDVVSDRHFVVSGRL